MLILGHKPAMVLYVPFHFCPQHPIGGRVTVLLSSRPSIRPGAVSKEAPSPGATKRVRTRIDIIICVMLHCDLLGSDQHVCLDRFLQEDSTGVFLTADSNGPVCVYLTIRGPGYHL